MPQIGPNMHSIGGNYKILNGSNSQYFYVFPRHPRQKRPWSYHYAFCEGSFRYPHFCVFPRHPRQKPRWSYHSAFCGGSFRHLYFYVFPRHPRQKRPWSHHYGFCVGVLWRTDILRCLEQRPQPGWILRGPSRCDRSPLSRSHMGPGEGAFFPAFRWWVERFFVT